MPTTDSSLHTNASGPLHGRGHDRAAGAGVERAADDAARSSRWVLAEAFDRRWLLFAAQLYFITVAVLLAVLTALGMMPPALLLAFSFAVGAGLAMLAPTWQALITELVPRMAARLDSGSD